MSWKTVLRGMYTSRESRCFTPQKHRFGCHLQHTLHMTFRPSSSSASSLERKSPWSWECLGYCNSGRQEISPCSGQPCPQPAPGGGTDLLAPPACFPSPLSPAHLNINTHHSALSHHISLHSTWSKANMHEIKQVAFTSCLVIADDSHFLLLQNLLSSFPVGTRHPFQNLRTCSRRSAYPC
jgi:hypothetical protein